MSNGSESLDKEIEGDLTFEQRLQLAKVFQGIGGQEGPPPDDETYAIFTSGDHAGKEFKRISRPSYGQRKKVEEIRLKSKMVSESVKEAICEELGWDVKEKAPEELSMMEYHKQLLPLLTYEDLPEKWDIEDVSSHEVGRMLHDFLLGT